MMTALAIFDRVMIAASFTLLFLIVGLSNPVMVIKQNDQSKSMPGDVPGIIVSRARSANIGVASISRALMGKRRESLKLEVLENPRRDTEIGKRTKPIPHHVSAISGNLWCTRSDSN